MEAISAERVSTRVIVYAGLTAAAYAGVDISESYLGEITSERFGDGAQIGMGY